MYYSSQEFFIFYLKDKFEFESKPIVFELYRSFFFFFRFEFILFIEKNTQY